MENVLTHELIHAYDNCRIKYDPDNVKHLACTEVFVSSILYGNLLGPNSNFTLTAEILACSWANFHFQ